ncbi:hypothetical protein E2562_001841 [Oryza meyeriana var. granulata]|uniref:Uncharacterized protein n=1 Tax=Oryza meyeriana var. granulata TaxID=110450 RepID=A0A6G1CDH7_9ORYZ|nr:hypothetical protein E2562_001841 [Oryza meyeriana var. granulata]KAF0898206.1 hypothetical protein E2562_001841 [Oryza meyeriana var. granulata]KAF0898207.1 hypothetical protein E2562_001841 [Oryza meyeriana var. granulata]KAF0898208.1 hypothetical protein E2562_001841 [Oryza meyeriana var. granulata]KAF0898209.1 hypothetical protein E2562_001841 [Oryza meyeriana var. granulata]
MAEVAAAIDGDVTAAVVEGDIAGGSFWPRSAGRPHPSLLTSTAASHSPAPPPPPCSTSGTTFSRCSAPPPPLCSAPPLLSAAAASSSSLHLSRLLHSTDVRSATATSFSVEEYLVDTCGLTGAQALKASKKVFHLKSASKPDAVLAILSGVGLSRVDLAAIVAAQPRLLCTRAHNIALRIASLRDRVGLSYPQIGSFLLAGGAGGLQACDVAPRLEFWIPFLGSFEMLLKMDPLLGLLRDASQDLEEKQRNGQLKSREGYQAEHRAAPGVRAKCL